MALDARVGLIVVDNFDELDRLERLTAPESEHDDSGLGSHVEEEADGVRSAHCADR